MNSFAVGIVGAGEITKLVHLPVLKSMAGAHVAWLADSNAQRVRTLGRAFQVSCLVVLEGEIDLPPCDIALLATPVNARRRYLEFFGARGSAVFTEKPFAISEGEHNEFLGLCPASPVGCGYMRRTYASVRALRRIVREGWFGNLLGIRYSEGGRVSKSGSSSSTLDLSFLMGGGVLRDLGCHGVDSLLYITSATDVTVRSSRLEWDRDTDRHVAAEFVLSGINGKPGAECHVEFAVSWLTPQSNTVVLEFENARVRAGLGPDAGLEIQRASYEGSWMSLSLEIEGARSSYQAFYLEWDDVLSSLRKGREGEFAASGSLMTTRLVDAIYRQGGGA